MSEHINLDALWVLGLSKRAEDALYNNGISSISQLKLLVRLGSVKRIRGIGPGIFEEIKQTLAVYDTTLDDIFAQRETSVATDWMFIIARPQTDGGLQVLYEQNCQPWPPMPTAGSYVLLPDAPQKYIVQSVYYAFTNSQIIVIVGDDRPKNQVFSDDHLERTS